MQRKLSFGLLACVLLIDSAASSPAPAEFQCAPADATPVFPTNDPFFADEVTAWSRTTSNRYAEGDRRCADVIVPGYEGFPTKRCSYANADAGEGTFAALSAQVILLDPSASQLAAWSIHACRANGAPDAVMSRCLTALHNYIVGSNGAQFPVVGSVVESYCNSSTSYGECKDLPKSSQWRKPRNTWFRDGISVDYSGVQGVHWDETAYPQSTFDIVFDVAKSDRNLDKTYAVARVSGALRDEWRNWRRHIGQPEMPDGMTGSVNGAGWRVVAAEVHKAACRGASNELMDAVVFDNPKWTTP